MYIVYPFTSDNAIYIYVWTIWSTVRKLCVQGPSSKCLNRVECDLEVFSNRAIFNCLFLRSQQRRYTENWNFFKSNFWTKTNPIAELYHGVALFCSMTWQLLTNPLIMTDGVTYKRSCDLYCNYIWGNFERPSLFMHCGLWLLLRFLIGIYLPMFSQIRIDPCSFVRLDYIC